MTDLPVQPGDEVTASGEPIAEPADAAAPTDAASPADTAEPDFEVPAPPETGDDRVDATLTELAGIAGRPPAEHVAVYEEVHRRLQDTLADLDES